MPVVRGVPFSGSSGICENVTLPLQAIVCLSQARETTIAPLTGIRAFRNIWEGCSVNLWNSVDVANATQTLLEIIRQVPVYQLSCTPDESAVLALEEKIMGVKP